MLKMVVVGDKGCADGKGGCGNPNVVERDHGSGAAKAGAYLPVDAVDVLRGLDDAGEIIECSVSSGSNLASQGEIQGVVVTIFPFPDGGKTDIVTILRFQCRDVCDDIRVFFRQKGIGIAIEQVCLGQSFPLWLRGVIF